MAGCARRTRDRLVICWTSRFLRNHIAGIFTCGFQKYDGGKRERHPALTVGPTQSLALTAGVKIMPAAGSAALMSITSPYLFIICIYLYIAEYICHICEAARAKKSAAAVVATLRMSILDDDA